MGKRKLTDEQRAEIYEAYWVAHATIYGLSKKYKVSRGTIQFIIRPELAEQNRERMRIHQQITRSIKRNERKEMNDGTSKG